nr:unnamed protein product [Callosobruchus analis]
MVKKRVKVREFSKLTGNLVSICCATEYGWLYLKSLEREKYLSLKRSSGNYNRKMEIAGPALLKILYLKQCKAYEDGDFRATFRLHMYNRTTQLFDANFSVPFDIDQNLKMKYSQIDRKLIDVALIERDLCNELPKYFGNFVYDLERKAGIPVGVCPIEKGNYTLENVYVNLKKFKTKIFLYGRFYIRIDFSKAARIVGCVESEIQLSPNFASASKNIVSDNGTEFIQNLLKDFAEIYNINWHYILPLNSNSNSIAERYHYTLTEHLRILNITKAKLRPEDAVCNAYEGGHLRATFRLHMYNKTTQLFDGNFSVPFDIDENIKMKCSRTDKRQMAITLSESDLCHALPKYFGGFLYDLERKAGVPVGVCPIRKGNYTLKNVYFDLEKFKIKMFLEGRFQLRMEFSNGAGTVGCVESEVQLSPK